MKPRAEFEAPRCGCGGSTHQEIAEAIREAVAAASVQLAATGEGGDAAADLAVVFVSAAHGQMIRPAMESLADLVPARTVIGTTAEGVLAGDDEFDRGPAVAVWMARLPGAWIKPVSLEYVQTPDGGMFAGWPEAVDGDWPANAALILLADPFSFPVDTFIKRMEEEHPGMPIVGGMASGGAEPGGNTLVAGPRTYESGAVGVLMGGAVRIRPVVSQGCRPIGKPMVITKSEENMIVELGGRPALERLREVYGGLDAADRELVRSSLHVGRAATEYRDTFQRGDFLVRNVVGADPESGVIAVGDLIRTGQTVQFHVRDAASADEDLRTLLSARTSAARPAGALVFTCNGRGLRLFDTANHDARCVQECLGPLPAAGFFAQGEIGPIGSRTFLHGFTASIAVVEAAE
ncbi:MAG: FIST C-terminal domain-containing protein [Planctomycetia bacterium]|nr:FIST C-terminal domain-containing protein [Planctomycetia bacterium]